MTLDRTQIGKTVTISEINGCACHRQRLGEMGFTQGAPISVLGTAAGGCPLRVNIRGYDISIRRKDASNIEVI